MNTSETPEVIDQDRRRLLGTAAMGIAIAGGASLLPSQLIAAPAGDAASETIRVRKEGAVLFAEISAPPMNLLGPELVRDLVSLIQRAEADDALKVLVFKSADPDYFISHVDVTRIREYRDEAAKLVGEPSIALLFRHLSASRLVTIAQIEGRVRGAGSEFVLACDMRFAAHGVGDFRSAGAGVGCDPRRRRRTTPRSPHGPRESARGHVERAGLRRGAGRKVWLDQSSVARQRARRFRQIARSSDRQVSGLRPRRGQGPGQCDRARARRGLPSRFRSLRRGLAQPRRPKADSKPR